MGHLFGSKLIEFQVVILKCYLPRALIKSELNFTYPY
jgi:hypothetical protein